MMIILFIIHFSYNDMIMNYDLLTINLLKR